MPPLPVTRIRSLQSSGSQSSNDILDLFDVGMESPTRQRFTATAWLGRPHVGSLSGSRRSVPVATYVSTWRLLLRMYASGVKDRHLSRKLIAAWTAKGNQKASNRIMLELRVVYKCKIAEFVPVLQKRRIHTPH